MGLGRGSSGWGQGKRKCNSEFYLHALGNSWRLSVYFRPPFLPRLFTGSGRSFLWVTVSESIVTHTTRLLSINLQEPYPLLTKLCTIVPVITGGQNDDFRLLTYTLGGRGMGCRDKYVTS